MLPEVAAHVGRVGEVEAKGYYNPFPSVAYLPLYRLSNVKIVSSSLLFSLLFLIFYLQDRVEYSLGRHLTIRPN